MNIPTTLRAGDSVSWSDSLADYSSIDGWVLKYALRGPHEIDIEATGTGTDHDVVLVRADTEDYLPGEYAWVAYVENVTDRVTLATGTLNVQPDLVAGSAAPSHAKKMLDAIQAVLEKKASKLQSEYTVDGNMLKFMTYDELIKAMNFYGRLYRREQEKAGLKPKRSSGYIKFGLR